jgi:acetylornithine deacetylase/succinyl-diaminopimelate desuccinylase-like protein
VDRPGVGKVIVGRGATNTKGPQTACLAALHAFKAAGRKLPVNLVLVCEGEEEIGSPSFRQIVFKPEVQAALSKCVGIIIPLGNQDPDGSVQVNLGAKGSSSSSSVSSARSGGAARSWTCTRASPRRWTAPRGTSCRRSTRS